MFNEIQMSGNLQMTSRVITNSSEYKKAIKKKSNLSPLTNIDVKV